MSKRFLTFVDEIMNVVLFLMVGFEVFLIAFETNFLIAGCMTILIALAAWLIAVAIPVPLLKPFQAFGKGAIPIMTWGGLRGGISAGLALSLLDGEWKPLDLAATYTVVIFSIIVQGLTVIQLPENQNCPAKANGSYIVLYCAIIKFQPKSGLLHCYFSHLQNCLTGVCNSYKTRLVTKFGSFDATCIFKGIVS